MFEQLVTGENLTLAGAVFAVLTTVKRVFPLQFKTPGGRRLLPLLPLILGIGGACIPGMLSTTEWADKITIGLIAGFASANLFKVGKTTMLGHGVHDSKKSADDGDNG